MAKARSRLKAGDVAVSIRTGKVLGIVSSIGESSYFARIVGYGSGVGRAGVTSQPLGCLRKLEASDLSTWGTER